MNTRGKKIEFAEMLSPKHALDKIAAKPTKQRNASFDGGKVAVRGPGRPPKRLSEAIPLQTISPKVAGDRGSKRSDSKVRTTENVIQVQSANTGSHENALLLKTRPYEVSSAVSENQVTSDKRRRSLVNQNGPASDRKDLRRGASLVETSRTDASNNNDHLKEQDKEGDSSSSATPVAGVPESCGRSTRRSQPLDYKFLAGLKDNRKRQKPSENATLSNRSPVKLKPDNAVSRTVKKVHNEANMTSGFEARLSQTFVGDGERVVSHESGKSKVLDSTSTAEAAGHVVTIKTEPVEVEPASAIDSINSTPGGLCDSATSTPSKLVISENTPVKDIRTCATTSAEETKTAVCVKTEPLENVNDKNEEKEKTVATVRDDGDESQSKTEDKSVDCVEVKKSGDDQIESESKEAVAGQQSASSSGVALKENSGGKGTEESGSGVEKPPPVAGNLQRRPYDSAQLSSLIEKIEARMNRLKNVPESNVGNSQSGNLVSNHSRGEKVSNIRKLKVEKGFDSGNNASSVDKKAKQCAIQKTENASDRRSFESSDVGSNRSVSGLPTIGKNKLYARRSLELSLGRSQGGSSTLRKGITAGGSKSLLSKIDHHKQTYKSTLNAHSRVSLLKPTLARPESNNCSASSSFQLSGKGKGKRKADSPEIDEIDGFTFMTFSSLQSLEEHMETLNANKESDVESSQSLPLYSDRIWSSSGIVSRNKAETMALCRLKKSELEMNGKIRYFSAAALSDLGLTINTEMPESPVADAAPDEGTSVGKVTRRGIGKMGNEKTQPSKGKIYGRKVTGRFASKANIKYHFKKRLPESCNQSDLVNSQLGSNGKQSDVGPGMTLTDASDCDLRPVSVTIKMAIAAARALHVESAAKKPCFQKECSCTGKQGIQPDYEPDLSNELLPDLTCSPAACRLEHCRLGCICDSLRSPQKRRHHAIHCGQLDCMTTDCVCPAVPENRSGTTDAKAKLEFSGTSSELPQNSGESTTRRKRRTWGIPVDESMANTTRDEGGQSLRKSGRIKESSRIHFSDIEKMKSLIYYDPTLWLQDDQGRPKRRKVEKLPRAEDISLPKFSATDSRSALGAPVSSAASQEAPLDSSAPATTVKPDPVAVEISDDEKVEVDKKEKELPSLSSPTSDQAKPQQEITVSDSSSKSEISSVVLPSESDDNKAETDDGSADDDGSFTSCARLLPYVSRKRLVDETHTLCNGGISLLKNSTADHSLKNQESGVAGASDPTKPSQRKSQEPAAKKFTNSLMLVKKNPSGREKLEEKKSVGPVILLDITCNCSWQEHRDPIVGKVYEMVADGQATVGSTFELENLVVELIPRSGKEPVIPKSIRETTDAASRCIVPIRITKKQDNCKLPPVPKKSSHAPPNPDVSLSGMKNFVSGSSFRPTTENNRHLATSCTFGPFASIIAANSVAQSHAKRINVPQFDVEESSGRSPESAKPPETKRLVDSVRLVELPRPSESVILNALKEKADDKRTVCEVDSQGGNSENKVLEMEQTSCEDRGEDASQLTDSRLDSAPAEKKEVISSNAAGADVSDETKVDKDDGLSHEILDQSESQPIDLSIGAETVVSTLSLLDTTSKDTDKMSENSTALKPSASSTPVSTSLSSSRAVENSDSVAPSFISGIASDRLVIAGGIKISPVVSDGLWPIKNLASSISSVMTPASTPTGVPTRLVPISGIRYISVGGQKKPLVASNIVATSLAKSLKSVLITNTSLTNTTAGSLPTCLLKPASVVTSKPGTILLTAPSLPVVSGSGNVAQKANFKVISSGLCITGGLTASTEQVKSSNCVLASTPRMVKIDVPSDKKTLVQKEYLSQVLKKFPNASAISVSNCFQLKSAVSNTVAKLSEAVSTVTVPAVQVPVSSPAVWQNPEQSGVRILPPTASADDRQGASNSGMKNPTKDVIEIPDDSDDEKGLEIDVLQSGIDGSNEATILREKLGIPLNCTKKSEKHTSQNPAGQPPKKKRKQMHEEKTEFPESMEITESWVMIPKDKADSKTETKQTSVNVTSKTVPTATVSSKTDSSAAIVVSSKPESAAVFAVDSPPSESSSSKTDSAAGASADSKSESVTIDSVNLTVESVVTVSANAASDSSKPKEKQRGNRTSSNQSASAFTELYSSLLRSMAPYLTLKKKKISKLFITRTAIKVIKHITDKNKALVSELVSEKLTLDRLQAKLKSLQAPDATNVEKASTSTDATPSTSESAGNKPPSERRRVIGPLRRKFRGISKKEELEIQNGESNSALTDTSDRINPNVAATSTDIATSQTPNDDVAVVVEAAVVNEEIIEETVSNTSTTNETAVKVCLPMTSDSDPLRGNEMLGVSSNPDDVVSLPIDQPLESHNSVLSAEPIETVVETDTACHLEV